MIVFQEFKLTGTLVPLGQLSTEFQLVNHTLQLDSENVPSKEPEENLRQGYTPVCTGRENQDDMFLLQWF